MECGGIDVFWATCWTRVSTDRRRTVRVGEGAIAIACLCQCIDGELRESRSKALNFSRSLSAPALQLRPSLDDTLCHPQPKSTNRLPIAPWTRPLPVNVRLGQHCSRPTSLHASAIRANALRDQQGAVNMCCWHSFSSLASNSLCIRSHSHQLAEFAPPLPLPSSKSLFASSRSHGLRRLPL